MVSWWPRLPCLYLYFPYCLHSWLYPRPQIGCGRVLSSIAMDNSNRLYWYWIIDSYNPLVRVPVTDVILKQGFWCRFICNKFLLKKSARDGVEWGYAFDVHLNSFVPLALIIFGLQMPLIGGVVTVSYAPLSYIVFSFLVLQHRTALWTVLANILWVCALCSYIYSTFLGYSGKELKIWVSP